jgi:DNA adenine methylase
MLLRLPHPIPYQGSKRLLARRILSVLGNRRFGCLYEPFAGSAAISIAAASGRLAERYELADTLEPLAELWQSILANPVAVADEYESIWRGQFQDPRSHYADVRDEFNARGGAGHLLYLLARCVKNAPRFNANGEFNQSADHRRTGMRPDKMRREIYGAAQLLGERATVTSRDFADAVAQATPKDVVYMDPPWEGTSTGVDKRYRDWLARDRLIGVLEDLHDRGVPYLLSYDGRHGDKTYGEWLPESIGAVRLELEAGRSSQATLNGRVVTTFESLYVSRSLEPVIEEQLGLLVSAAPVTDLAEASRVRTPQPASRHPEPLHVSGHSPQSHRPATRGSDSVAAL